MRPFLLLESAAESSSASFTCVAAGGFSDFRVILLTKPSHPVSREQWRSMAFVTGYSGGTVPDFNGIPL